VVTALYRRYRPETFAEMIGQSQVTEPLMTALRTNRVNHAYLFSGPRGCGKTTSARILARCLNCAEGPTDTPCGKCDSCVELGRGGGGSLDVVEIDAASHNGVDDARDIRERAVFAPARDRFKVFILDEAHMVTPQGFNALLKIVEEPPEHVKFIFATTEPDKVIGTIRSRTHHYPFRLVPPGLMLDYVQQLCDSEGVGVAPGVLPLVVRAGGGSPRDTLSLLDQLMAGTDGDSVQYERAVALLGYTHAALLDEVIGAIAVRDASAAFGSVDRVIQTGQDPRRFVEDLLERLRDLIVVQATSPESAAAVLRGVPQEEIDRMSIEAAQFGAAELSRAADLVNAALTEMTGATSPRLHLELMIARMLVPSSDESERGALARVERLERRVGVSDAISGVAAGEPAPAASASHAAPPSAPAPAVPAPPAASASAPAASAPVASPPVGSAPAASATETSASTTSAPAPSAVDSSAPEAAAPVSAASESAESSASAAGPAARSTPSGASSQLESPASSAPAPIAGVTTQQIKDAWPQVLEAVEKAKRSAWVVVYTAQVRSLADDVLTLTFPSDNDVASFRQQQAGQGVSEYLRQAIVDVLGIRVKFIAKTDAGVARAASAREVSGGPQPSASAPVSDPAPDPGTTSPGRPAPERPTQNRPAQHRPAQNRADQGSATSRNGTTAGVVAAPDAGTVAWPEVAVPGAGFVNAQESAAGSPVPDVFDEPPAEYEPEDERWYAGDDVPDADIPESVTPAPAASPAAASPSAPAPSPAPQREASAAGSSAAGIQRSVAFQEPQRYGEAVVREILGASFIEEESVPPGGGR
jgi:DNA polymerase-3 subunit gamma/tau